jgi:integrase
MTTITRLQCGADIVRHRWRVRLAAGELTPGTEARYERVFSAFLGFIGAHGVPLARVDPKLCRAFVFALRRGGETPAASTSRFRLTVVRDAFATLTSVDGNYVDPTRELRVVQGAQSRTPAPLTPGEVGRLRSSGRLNPRDHLRPAAVELALAGGSHAEIAATVVRDVDLSKGAVALGTRQVQLEPFAGMTLAGRVAACRRAARRTRRAWDPATTSIALSRPLATYPLTSVAPSISSSLSRAMAASGIAKPGLRPASLREYAANQEYARRGRVEDVATLLGLHSLDVARGLIDEEWQRRYADEVRS